LKEDRQYGCMMRINIHKITGWVEG